MQAYDIHRGNADCLVNRNRSTHANRDTAFDCKNLSKAAHIDPLLAGSFCKGILVGILTLDKLAKMFIFRGTVAQIGKVIGTGMVFRLHIHILAHVLQSVPDLPLDAHIRNFAAAVIIFSGTVSVQRIAVGVCVCGSDQHCEVNLMFQYTHELFLLVSVFSGFIV